MMHGPYQRICIFGAGAIGGTIAAMLASSPALQQVTISIVARGANLRSIREEGIRLKGQVECEAPSRRLIVTDDPEELTRQDLIIVTLKAHQLPPVAGVLAVLAKNDTPIVIVQNGIPWWYFYGDKRTSPAASRISLLDPDGLLWSLVGPARVVGGVTTMAASVVRPGEISVSSEGTLSIGDPRGEDSPALSEIKSLLEAGGLTVSICPDIREQIWLKLIGNIAFNPISALTRSDLTALLGNEQIVTLAAKAMREAIGIAALVGVEIKVSPEDRILRAKALGGIRPSMLQDLEAGRSLEVDALLGAVVAMGQSLGAKTDTLEVLQSLTSQLGNTSCRRSPPADRVPVSC